MRTIMVLLMSITAILRSESVLCQPLTAAEKMSAKTAARSVLGSDLKHFQAYPQMARPLGIADSSLGKLPSANLGRECAYYALSKASASELDKIDDISVIARYKAIEFAVPVDDRTTLVLLMKSRVDATTKAVIWERASWVGGNVGLRNAEIGKEYPEAQGYEMTHVRLGDVADYYIIRKGSECFVRPGIRDIGSPLWVPGISSRYDRVITVGEFMDIVRRFANGE